MKELRKANGACIKCGRKGHQARECRTGWKVPTADEKKGYSEAIKDKKEDKKDKGKAKDGNMGEASEESDSDSDSGKV